MSWLIKQYSDGKFGLWTTIADGWIIKKAKREYIINWIIEAWQSELESKITELENTFPNGWFDKDTLKMIRIGG